jgi:hypothetical protein
MPNLGAFIPDLNVSKFAFKILVSCLPEDGNMEDPFLRNGFYVK